jgi:DNA-binding winged helix-turn-helix (wHTH) protein
VKVFGDFEFDEEATQLRRGGTTVPVNGQCLELLALMLDRPGAIITREEIQRALWPDSMVEFEHSLDVLVNRLRMALGDNSKNARYIQTVPKKGYRFAERVSLTPSGYQASTSGSRTRRIGRYAAVAVLAALLTLLFAQTRYEKFVPTRGATTPSSSR